MRNLIFFLCILIMPACSIEKNDDIVNADAGQESTSDASADLLSCKDLDEKSCQSTPGCHPLFGIPFDDTRNDCTDEHFITCVRDLRCNNGAIYHHQDGQGVCWALSGGCFISDNDEVLDCVLLSQTPFCQD